MIRTGGEAYMQMIASAIKLPMLFFLTLAVTFPSLYVFNALIGTRLSVASALRLLIAALGVMLAVLASLGPIVVFFALSTKSYPFMVLLNVGTSTVAGMLGLGFLLRTLDRLVIVQEDIEITNFEASVENVQGKEAEGKKIEPSGALDRMGKVTTRKAKSVFRIWTIVLASFAPFTILWYVSFSNYRGAILFNTLMFGIASFTAQWLLRRFYEPLIRRNRRHRALLRAWLVIYAFVGIQMAWVLRPFIGYPYLPPQFFRQDAWGNAYVRLANIIWTLIGG